MIDSPVLYTLDWRGQSTDQRLGGTRFMADGAKYSMSFGGGYPGLLILQGIETPGYLWWELCDNLPAAFRMLGRENDSMQLRIWDISGVHLHQHDEIRSHGGVINVRHAQWQFREIKLGAFIRTDVLPPPILPLDERERSILL